MNATPSHVHSHAAATLVFAAGAALISVSLLGGVATLFLSAGTPFGPTALPPQACAAAVTQPSPCPTTLAATAKNPGVAGR